VSKEQGDLAGVLNIRGRVEAHSSRLATIPPRTMLTGPAEWVVHSEYGEGDRPRGLGAEGDTADTLINCKHTI
jgi:hypothetical protein